MLMPMKRCMRLRHGVLKSWSKGKVPGVLSESLVTSKAFSPTESGT